MVGGLSAGLGWMLTGSVLGALAGAGIGFVVALIGLDLLLSGCLLYTSRCVSETAPVLIRTKRLFGRPTAYQID